MDEENFSYKKALEEIEGIVEKIEADEPDVDQLADMVKKAAVLLKLCRKKLRDTGEELDQLLDEFEE